jgi:hypothetical protein
MIEPKLDIRHIRIINEIKDVSEKKEVLVVGAGDCKKDYHLIKDGFSVYSTDYQRASWFDKNMESYFNTLNYSLSNIFNIESFPIKKSEIVMCCEVLEHLPNYKEAFNNLLELTEKRLIVTVPWRHSFNDPRPFPEGHCNWWDDTGSGNYKNIYEFEEMSNPNKIHIEKIRTKHEDVQRNQYSYLIIIDKN